MKAPDPRWLIGRTIVAYDNGTNESVLTSGARPSHNPVLTLDNGARLSFIVEELLDGDDYGIFPLYHHQKR